MTRQSDHIVPLKVTVRLDPTSALAGQLDGQQFMCCAAEDGTLADLRVVLAQDKVIAEDDGSIFVFDGRAVGKTSESHIKWSSLLKNEEIVLSRMSTSLLRKSKLGKGIIISEDNGPQYAGHAVIADGDSVAVSLLDTQETCDETIHSYSTIAAEFARAGWSKFAIASVSSSMIDDNSPLPHTNVWITGRQLHSTCQMTLPSPRALQPHPEFKAAVEEALEEQDITRRRQKLDMVWQRHGTFYVDSVEMGGMCHATRVLEVSQKNTGESELRRMLAEQFASEFQSERDTGEKHTSIPANLSGMFSRVGGCQDEGFSRWRASLVQPANWSTTRILQVVPVIELLDADVQAKITSLYPTPVLDGRRPSTGSEPSSASTSESSAKDSEPPLMAYADDESDENATASLSHSSSVSDSALSSSQAPSSESVVPAETLANPEASVDTKSSIAAELQEIVEHEVNALLDKLTADQFNLISSQIIAWLNKFKEEKDARTLKKITQAIFTKATGGADSSEICARLCHKMVLRIDPTIHDNGSRNEKGKLVLGGQLFRKYLVNCCQESYECLRSVPTAEGYRTAPGRGLIKFVGELFKVHIITKPFMMGFIKTLFHHVESKHGEEIIESLCQLLTTVGALLDSGKIRAELNVYFYQLVQLRNDYALSPHIRSMMQNVVELRGRKWIPDN